MTFHPTDCHCHGIFLICCSSISPTVVVLASMRCILAFCCAGLRPIVWQLQLPAWLSKQCHLNVSSTYSSPNIYFMSSIDHQCSGQSKINTSTYSPSPEGPARSPQPILRLRPSSSICFLCRSTVILLLSATIISLRPLIRQLLSVSLLFFPGQEQLVAGLAQCPRSLPANCRLLHIISPQVALPPCYT